MGLSHLRACPPLLCQHLSGNVRVIKKIWSKTNTKKKVPSLYHGGAYLQQTPFSSLAVEISMDEQPQDAFVCQLQRGVSDLPTAFPVASFRSFRSLRSFRSYTSFRSFRSACVCLVYRLVDGGALYPEELLPLRATFSSERIGVFACFSFSLYFQYSYSSSVR